MMIFKKYFYGKSKALNRASWFLLGLSLGLQWLPLSIGFLVLAVLSDFLSVALSGTGSAQKIARSGDSEVL